MNKTAVIFPGQGSQCIGMGKDFYENSPVAKEIFDAASEQLNLDMPALCFEENDKLNLTEYTQAALVTTCLAMARTAMGMGLQADVTAGLSLGEYSALAFAGGMCDRDAIHCVRQRGIFMQEAVPANVGSMAAVLGLKGHEVDEAIQGIPDVSVANYNCPGQIVITGKVEGLEVAKKSLEEAGARRIIPLNVSGPFHSPLLKDAQPKLDAVLHKVPFHDLKIPYVTNVTAEYITDISQTHPLLVSQIVSSVYWQQSIECMIKNGVDTFIEIGPGKTLTGFLRKIDRSVKAYNIGTWEELESTMEKLTGVNTSC